MLYTWDNGSSTAFPVFHLTISFPTHWQLWIPPFLFCRTAAPRSQPPCYGLFRLVWPFGTARHILFPLSVGFQGHSWRVSSTRHLRFRRILSIVDIILGWTNLWRMYHVRQGRYQVVIHDLHKKYGPVVRIAPNVVDLDLPELIKTIYSTKGDFRKARIIFHIQHSSAPLTSDNSSFHRPNSIMEAVRRTTGRSSTTYSASATQRSMRSRNGQLPNTIR